MIYFLPSHSPHLLPKYPWDASSPLHPSCSHLGSDLIISYLDHLISLLTDFFAFRLAPCDTSQSTSPPPHREGPSKMHTRPSMSGQGRHFLLDSHPGLMVRHCRCFKIPYYAAMCVSCCFLHHILPLLQTPPPQDLQTQQDIWVTPWGVLLCQE